MTGFFVEGRVTALMLFTAFAAFILLSIRASKKGYPITLREIPGYDAVDELVGRAVEMGRPVHFTPGKYELRIDLMAGLAAMEHVARTAIAYDAKFVVTTGRGDTFALADAMVQQAYAEAGKPEGYSSESVLYLSDNQFAFASAVMGMIARERVAANIMIGAYGAESLLIAEAACGVNAMQIAGESKPMQLPFFIASCDYVVMGEELFAAQAYFTKDPMALGYVRGQDLGKALCMLILIAGVIDSSLGGKFILNLLNK